MPPEKVEQLERTVIFKGFPKDMKNTSIVEFITARLGDHVSETDGKAYATRKWSERGFVRFKTKGAINAFLKMIREGEGVVYGNAQIRIGPDRGLVLGQEPAASLFSRTS